ncbi:unnamed protein product [Amaranthus hypochondriacus]
MRSQVPNIFLLLCWCLVLCYLFNVHLANANGLCIDKERDALLQFKAGVWNDSCGLLSSWNHHDCCQWDGVHCSNHTGHVIKLILRTDDVYIMYEFDSCLHGKLSSSLVDLKQLRYLDLDINNFFSNQPFPSFISSLSKLEYLNLSNSFFQGDIPPQLGNLSHLTVLDLSFNGNMAGDLSWLSRLTFLRHINLSGVDLSKATNWLKIVNNLPFLRVLRLDSCLLEIVPRPLSYINSSTTLSVLSLAQNYLNDSSIFQWLFNLSGINTHLTHIDLSQNQLHGPLPSSFGNLQALSYLDLSNNNLDGTVPTSFRKLQSLSFLSLAYNQFHGQIPDVGNSKNLTIFDLSSNKFQVWPKTFSLMCSLQELYLDFNSLTQELSTIIQTLTGFGCVNYSLSDLDLSNNQIWGSVPSNIVAFSSLSVLDLGGNRLNGTISQSLGKLSMLILLNLSSNSLKDSLFTNHFSNLSYLVDLDLSYNPELKFKAIPPSQLHSIQLGSCKLGPSFPKWLLAQKRYSVLDISSAGISDRIPKSFWNSLSPQLNFLNMSHNNIHGTLPTLYQERSFHDLDYLDIDLSFNSFEGTLPLLFPAVTSFLLNDNKLSDPSFFLCPKNMSRLRTLDLSNNLLSGELPDCWMNFSQLCILRLANNNIFGVVPASIGYLEQLQVLHLSNNSFSGQVPRSFDNLTSLNVLDLAYNSLSGLIQSAIGKYSKKLIILRLRNNHFVGGIPLSLCEFSFLQILDLSKNHISGSIPKCIYNLTSMKNGTNLLPELQYDPEWDLELSNSDYYIEAATIMWKRKDSIFRNSLGLVKEIDMSNNELQGEIPNEIFSLTGLVSLDLSSNTLSGTFTTKVGQLTELEFLDLSNNHLSGEIPESLANLNSLGILDLSYNNLSGEIPTGPLLQGFDTSAYEGNPNLCGMPLPKCPWEHPTPDLNALDHYNDENESEGIYHLGLYISLVLGFIIGFWGVCGSLVLKRSWKHTFFKYFDDLSTRCMSYF